ncbi:hypothetical protein Golob_005536 [Gossypium lobatum]|uniref:DUF4283 domain-containing protein n=1 Tax=Gossypium lobatum TaxID=34289 RepID=A0A7J8MTX8_9ROSI|nr:hypothetical protein [Gossypium lobatum]
MAWVRLPRLLGFMYKRKVFEVIGSTIGKVEYEAFPTIYFACGKYGHVRKMCSLSNEGSDKESDKLIVEGKGRIGSRFDVLIDGNEMSRGERGIVKEFFRVLASQMMETDLAFSD